MHGSKPGAGMKTEVKIPEVGESVTEALLTQWYRRDGDFVRKGEILFLIETDKVTLEVVAEGDGVLKILVPEGATVAVGTVVAVLDADDARESEPAKTAPERTAGVLPPSPVEAAEVPSAAAAEPSVGVTPEVRPQDAAGGRSPEGVTVAPAALRLAAERGVELAKVEASGPGGRVTRGDVLLFLEQSAKPMTTAPPEGAMAGSGEPSGDQRQPPAVPDALPLLAEPTTRQPMSRIRQRIAERLLAARQNTAMLTTFNEVDMSSVQTLRARFREAYRTRYGVSLGIMSFFIKAAVAALKEYPAVNSFIEGHEIVTHHYYHLGVAIGAERGLVVPVIRHADRLGFAAIEQAILDYVTKVRENRLELSDLEGGTFTISNGGVYGSLLSTPILNPPQSGILGLHRIQDRPVAIAGEVVIRPMMYLALTYDHRLIDGKEAVSFLKSIRDNVENPERLMLEI